jgi:hypothetical protein
VSRGIEDMVEGETTKQSSTSGSEGPRVKVLWASMSGYFSMLDEVGIPLSSMGR